MKRVKKKYSHQNVEPVIMGNHVAAVRRNQLIISKTGEKKKTMKEVITASLVLPVWSVRSHLSAVLTSLKPQWWRQTSGTWNRSTSTKATIWPRRSSWRQKWEELSLKGNAANRRLARCVVPSFCSRVYLDYGDVNIREAQGDRGAGWAVTIHYKLMSFIPKPDDNHSEMTGFGTVYCLVMMVLKVEFLLSHMTISKPPLAVWAPPSKRQLSSQIPAVYHLNDSGGHLSPRLIVSAARTRRLSAAVRVIFHRWFNSQLWFFPCKPLLSLDTGGVGGVKNRASQSHRCGALLAQSGSDQSRTRAKLRFYLRCSQRILN